MPPPAREARTMRECFDQVPEDAEKIAPDKKRASQEEEQDALRSYFREMGEMPQLSPQEEFDLWEQIDRNVCSLRESIYLFAFVYDEHIKLLANPDEDLADIFPPSTRDNASLPDDPVHKRGWSAQIAEAVARMRAAYGTVPRPEFDKLRKAGFDTLAKHSAVLENCWSGATLHAVIRKTTMPGVSPAPNLNGSC